jgi:hypothetical protein
MSESLFDYTLEKMPAVLPPALAHEIVNFWVGEGALYAEDAQKRVREVHHVARHGITGAMVGVCTVKPIYIESMQLTFYNCRSFVSPGHRSHSVMKHLFFATYDDLNAAYDPQHQPALPVGIFLDIENTLLKQRKGAVWTEDRNLTFIGVKPNGNHIRIAYFDGAQI